MQPRDPNRPGERPSRPASAVPAAAPRSLLHCGTAIVLVGMASALAACDKPSIAAPVAPPTPVRIEAVQLEPAHQIQRYAAVVRPRIEADISFRVGGKVIERLVDVGARIEAGATLARLDPADLDARVRAAEAQLRSAKAVAVNAHGEFARHEALQKNGWVTRQEHDKRRAEVEIADARVRELEAQLAIARDNARYATLVADASGIVTASLVEPGQVVSAGQTVFRIARLREMEAVANIPESQVGLLDQASLSVELWSMPGVAIRGRLRELSPSADPATRTYQARVSLVDPPPGVQLGMTATLVQRRPNDRHVARLPMTALTNRGTDPAVWVLNQAGDGIELRTVTVGTYTGDNVTVLNGLEGGERVVTAGVHKLHAAQKVRVWTEPVR